MAEQYYRTFKSGEEILDVPAENVEKFLAKFPDAKEYKAFVVDQDTLDVPIENVSKFLSKVNTAKPLYAEQITKPAEEPQNSFLTSIGNYFKPALEDGAESPIAAGGELLMKLLDVPQSAVTAIPSTGRYNQPLEKTYGERFAKAREPSEVFPGFMGIPYSGAMPSPEFVDFLMDVTVDPLLLPLTKIAGGLKTLFKAGKNVAIDEVKNLLKTIPEIKKLPPLSDDAVIELVRRGQKAGVLSTGEIITGSNRTLKALPAPEMVTVAGKQVPSSVLPTPPQLHAEGILESIKKVTDNPVPKSPGKQKISVSGKFAEVEKTPSSVDMLLAKVGTKPAKEFDADVIKFVQEQRGNVGNIITDLTDRIKGLPKTEEGIAEKLKLSQTLDMIKQASGKAKAAPEGLVEKVAASPSAEGKATLSGKDFGKGLIESVKKDIGNKNLGIVSDPYRNLREFVKENKVKLTDKEVADISNYAKVLRREFYPEAKREKLFNEYLKNNFPEIRYKTTTPLENAEQIAKAKKDIKPDEPIKFEIDDTKFELKEEVLNKELHNKTVNAFTQTMVDKGILRDKINFPVLSDQFLDSFSRGKISFKDVTKYGVTEDEFVYELFRDSSVRQSAQRLNKLSRASKILNKELNKELKGALDEFDEIDNIPDNTIKLKNVLQRIDNIRRGLLVSQLSTAMRNASTQSMRIGLDVFDDSFEIALGKLFKTEGFNKAKFVDAIKIFTRLGKKNKQIVEDVLKMAPAEYDRLFATYSSDVLNQVGVDKILGTAEKAVGYLNWANKLQEFTIRRAAFVGKLNEVLDKKGINLLDIYENTSKIEKQLVKKYGKEWRGKVNELEALQIRDLTKSISDKDLKEAVDYSLEMTFAKNPEHGSISYHLIKAINKMPMLPTGTGSFPFSRFIYNAVRFNIQHSPFGYFRLMNPEQFKQLGKAIANKPNTLNVKAISRATTGSAMLLGAWQLRNSKNAGEKWYEVVINNKTYDTRAYNPFAAYLFAAEFIKRIKEKRPMSFKDVALGIVGSNLRAGTGLYALDKLVEGFSDEKSYNKFLTMVKEYTGELASGFLTPLNQINNFLAAFDNEQAKQRDDREEPFLGPIKEKIPFMRTGLPEAEKPTRAATPQKTSPLLALTTGFLELEPKNKFEKELDRLDFTFPEIYPRTGNTKADRQIRKYMGEGADLYVMPYLESDSYKSLSDAGKAENLRIILSKLRLFGKAGAINNADENTKEFFKQLKLGSWPKRKKKFMEEILQQGARQ